MRDDARLSALPICQRTSGPNSKTTPPGVISSRLGGSSSASRAAGFTAVRGRESQKALGLGQHAARTRDLGRGMSIGR